MLEGLAEIDTPPVGSLDSKAVESIKKTHAQPLQKAEFGVVVLLGFLWLSLFTVGAFGCLIVLTGLVLGLRVFSFSS